MSDVSIIQKSEAPVTFNYFDSQQFEVIQRVCTMLANSELVPDMYKIKDGNPKEKAIANCMIAVEASLRIGCSALMVMQNMDVIYGRPAWRAKFLIATVNTCGRFETLTYRFTEKGKIGKIKIIEYVWDGKRKAPKEVDFDGTNIDNTECVAVTRKKGTTETLESSPVSILLAIQEGWYNKAGSKWPNMPRKMLINRAASFWTNEYAPELSMGMHTDEEVKDFIEYEEVDVMKKKVENKISAGANKTVVKMEGPGPAAPAAGEAGSSSAEPQKEEEKKEEKKTEENPI